MVEIKAEIIHQNEISNHKKKAHGKLLDLKAVKHLVHTALNTVVLGLEQHLDQIERSQPEQETDGEMG